MELKVSAMLWTGVGYNSPNAHGISEKLVKHLASGHIAAALKSA